MLFLVLLFPVQVFTDSKDISFDCLISINCSFSHVSVRIGCSYWQWQILKDLKSKTTNCILSSWPYWDYTQSLTSHSTVTKDYNSNTFLPIQQQQKILTLISVYRFSVFFHDLIQQSLYWKLISIRLNLEQNL